MTPPGGTGIGESTKLLFKYHRPGFPESGFRSGVCGGVIYVNW